MRKEGRSHLPGVTHQEFLQVLVVGDDAIVDDYELWGQRKGSAKPCASPSLAAEPTHVTVGRALGRIKHISPSGAIPCSGPLAWLGMGGDNSDMGGTKATQTLQSLWRHLSTWQLPSCWEQ